MAIARQAKRPCGLWVKMTAVTMLGLCFILVWTVFSSSSSSTSVAFQRESFEDILEPVSSSHSVTQNQKQTLNKKKPKPEKIIKDESEKRVHNGSSSIFSSATRPHQKKKGVARETKKRVHREEKEKEKGNQNQQGSSEKEEGQQQEEDGLELDREGEVDVDVVESVDEDSSEMLEDGNVVEEEEEEELKKLTSKGKVKGPLFDPNASYKWKICSTRSKHNYIPCIDIEVGGGKVQSYRHTERSCPRTPLMCMVPLPLDGYGSPVPWPESKLKV